MKNEYCLFLLLLLNLFMEEISTVMLKKECPADEIHRSCSFFDEYRCWEGADRQERVRSSPRRLQHCKAGCFCKKGLVRAFFGGRCITAVFCRDRKLQNLMMKLPKDFIGF